VNTPCRGDHSLRQTIPLESTDEGGSALPFLKWAGGKSLVARRVISRLGRPERGATYFEPFLGGGAVFFRHAPPHAVLSDLNGSLVETYQTVKNDVEGLIEELESVPAPTSRDSYENLRAEFNSLKLSTSRRGGAEKIRRSALFIWLNHTCFNGLYRENLDGEFNVPFGYYKDAFIYNPENLRRASSALVRSHADLLAVDFAAALSSARAGDQIYLDPPYDPVGETANFTGYTSTGFGSAEQWQLSQLVHQLLERGCRPVLSNSPTDDIRELYSDLGHEMVLVPRAINCDGAKRGRVGEMLFFPRHRITLHERLDRVVKELGFDLDGARTFEISSDAVKDLGGAEPRLIAKMDTREDLPPLLASKGYFVLPTAARRYAFVPGEGYHDLEGIDDKPKRFTPLREVPVSVALKSGESAAVQTALYSGLLEEVVGVPQLRATLHNDPITIQDAQIRYDSAWKLRLRGAQGEVDAGFENHGDYFIFECKAWKHSGLKDFNIRQLFFPQLHTLEKFAAIGIDLKPRCYFLNIELESATYRFWEYRFRDPHDYASLELVSRSSFRLEPTGQPRPAKLLDQLIQKEPTNTTYVPQADDPSKIFALLEGVAEGISSSKELAIRFQFDPRQSSYYGEAAEELGLVDRDRKRGFTLTDAGSKVVRMNTDDAAHEVIERVFALPVFREIASRVIANGVAVVADEDLSGIIAKASRGRYNSTTIERRKQSVVSWLNWIGEVTGTVRVRPTLPPLGGVGPLERFGTIAGSTS
jgi:DNA adenine methylase